METFLAVYETIAVVIIAPIVQWIGRKIPGDFPFGSTILNLGFNILFAWLTNLVLGLNLTTAQVWPYIGVGAISSAGIHALGKTAEKNGINTLGIFAPKVPGDHSN